MRGGPVSAFHGVLAKIGRERHATRLNRIANHPDVRPFVAGPLEGDLDFTDVIRNDANILLMSQHGGILFTPVIDAVYEAHTLVLPEGRGEWAADMVRAALHWMFTRTGCLEVMTKCPKGNLAATTLTRSMGLRPAYWTAPQWPLRGEIVPCHVHTLTIQEWMVKAPGLIDRGQWADNILKRSSLTITGTEDDSALRYLGLFLEMFLNGQMPKGAILFNRWAGLAGYAPCEIVSEHPPAVAFTGATIVAQDNGGRFYTVASAPGTSLL
jgi:hypothetical protein